MKRFIRSKLGLMLATCILIAVAIATPSISSALFSHAASPSAGTSPGRSFSSSGQGVVTPKKVSTFATLQVPAKEQGSVSFLPGPGGRAKVPSPQNVVRVPAPTDANLQTNTKFVGQAENGFQPSDSNGAGGLNNYVETVNEQWAVYSRTGTQQFETNFNTWFRISGSIFDPVVQWDKTGKRFLFIADTGSSLLLSVAQQTNGVGNYCNYTFPTPSGDFADYEKLGVDADGVYFSVNLYVNNNFSSNELFFANRTQLESCATVNFTTWSRLTNPDGSVAFAIVPARQDSGSSHIEYLVNSYSGGACKLTLWSLTSSKSLSNRSVSTQCYSPPPPAKQLGSSGTIDAGDNRLYQANFLNGLLTLDTVGSHDFGDGNGPVGIVEWFVLKASSATVSTQGSFGTPGFWLFYPATILNSAGNTLFVYNASGTTIHPSIWYVNQTLSGTKTLASGAGIYGTSGTARWGDYQSAWLDPATTSVNSIWITGQYAKAKNVWGTEVGRVTP